MDLFQYASVASQFTNELWICFLVGGLCFLIVYIFQGMGLYTIAKHEGYGKRWMAWVPFLQVYYIGVCSQKNKVLGSFNTKIFAIAVAICDILLFVGYTLYYVSDYLTLDYQVWTYVPITESYGYEEFTGYINLPSTLSWAAWIFEYLGVFVLQWLRLLFIIGKLFLYTSFYRTYSARRYFLFSIVGALLPVNGIIIYCVRNNKGYNYNEYIRKVREENYRRYQQQMQQQQNNPYNQNPYSRGYGAPPPQNDPYNNPYNNNPYNNNGQQGSSAPDPFEEYANGSGNNSNGNSSGSSADDSPFDEFN